ncbi:MAG: COX15/CtaA family protein, partial [Magnetococcales bacterium]|nr:COX15/CtaA family protein [Magnetococcales bacterium]
MLWVMVVVGGLTRLTGSGLSMVSWAPVTGWLPPLDRAGWEAAFADYRLTPQFRHVNWQMDLVGFQGIYWLEYVHRLLGRLLGVLFFVPFLWFVARRRI